MKPFIIILPARYASLRLPAKALADVNGKPLVVRAAQNAHRASAEKVIVATDDERIADALKAYDIDFVMTDSDLPSGTDRIAQAVKRLGLTDDAVIVNVQGDEPAMPPDVIDQLAMRLYESEADIVTASAPITELEEYLSTNAVKVVLDKDDNALYFSRSAIPYNRDAADVLPKTARRHLGIYAYRAGFIQRYSQLAQSDIEQYESLEQLRALSNGYRINVVVLDEAPLAGIDTLADLNAYRAACSDD